MVTKGETLKRFVLVNKAQYDASCNGMYLIALLRVHSVGRSEKQLQYLAYRRGTLLLSGSFQGPGPFYAQMGFCWKSPMLIHTIRATTRQTADASVYELSGCWQESLKKGHTGYIFYSLVCPKKQHTMFSFNMRCKYLNDSHSYIAYLAATELLYLIQILSKCEHLQVMMIHSCWIWQDTCETVQHCHNRRCHPDWKAQPPQFRSRERKVCHGFANLNMNHKLCCNFTACLCN